MAKKKRRSKRPTRRESLKALERRLYAIAERRAKIRIEKAIDQAVNRVARRYINCALGKGAQSAEVLMHVIDRFLPAAPKTLIIVKKEVDLARSASKKARKN